jgi:hypothetical protein
LETGALCAGTAVGGLNFDLAIAWRGAIRRQVSNDTALSSIFERMSYRDRFRLAWELTWPMAVIDVAVVLVIHGLFETGGETWDSLWAVASFFTAAPWVVRRALRRKYGRWRVMPPLDYQRSLKVMWLLAWRTLALSLAALLVVSFIVRAIGGGPHTFRDASPLINNLALSAIDALSTLVLTPLLIPGMLRKHYRGFRLELMADPGRR